MSTQEDTQLTSEQMQSVWDEEAAKLSAPAGETLPTEPEPVAKVVATPEPAPVEEAPDPLAGVPDAVREKLAALDKLSERLRNVEGNIGGLSNGQKQIKDLLTASQEAAKKVDDAPTQAAVKAAMQTPERWQSLKTEFPDWSDAVEAFVDSRIAGGAPTGADSTAVETLVDAKLAKITPAIRREVAEEFLEGEFGEWKAEVNTPTFVNWLNVQPEEVKALATSERVSAAAKLLRLYRNPTTESAPKDPGAEITKARQETLEAATALPKGSHVPPTKSVDDMTEQELWEYEAAQAAKRRTARGY